MSDLLFAVPWWIPTLLVVIGIVLFINGNKVQVDKVRNAGIGLAAFAVLWGLVSFFVDTDKEKVEQGTRDLVKAAVDGVASGNWAPFKSRMASDVTFAAGPSGSDSVTDRARSGAEMIKLRSAAVRDLELKQTDTYITAECNILSTQEFNPPLETTTWQFVWIKAGGDWKVHEIRLLKAKDIPDDQLDAITHFGARK